MFASWVLSVRSAVGGRKLRWPLAIGTRGRYAISAFLGQGLYSAITFLGTVAAARVLGPHGKGELTAWLLTNNLGALVLSGSIPNGLGRAYLQNRRKIIPATIGRHVAVVFAVTALVSGALVVGGFAAVS